MPEEPKKKKTKFAQLQAQMARLHSELKKMQNSDAPLAAAREAELNRQIAELKERLNSTPENPETPVQRDEQPKQPEKKSSGFMTELRKMWDFDYKEDE